METSVDTLIRVVQYRAERVNDAPGLAPFELAEKESKVLANSNLLETPSNSILAEQDAEANQGNDAQ
jgi:hypothetical protein